MEFESDCSRMWILAKESLNMSSTRCRSGSGCNSYGVLHTWDDETGLVQTLSRKLAFTR